MDELKNDIIEGRNAVLEALRAGRAIDKLYIARGETDRALGHIAGLARERGIAVSDCDRRKLDAMSVTKAHQGVIAVCAATRAWTTSSPSRRNGARSPSSSSATRFPTRTIWAPSSAARSAPGRTAWSSRSTAARV